MELPALAASPATRKIPELERALGAVIRGKDEVLRLSVVCLLSRGHLLIEDVPGVGKTTLAHTLARTVDCSFQRLQCTSDMLPGDILGVTVYNAKTGEFEFKPGPIFTNFLLADEINRATPKTQSALLEAMNERQITIDGKTMPLPEPFLVIATQNPVEHHGTYPLPESQLDRFLLRQNLGYPPREHERQVVVRQCYPHPLEHLAAVTDAAGVLAMQEAVKQVHVSDVATDYLLSIVEATRTHASLYLGASPRGSIALYRAAQAYAVVTGHEYVLPDHIKQLAPRVLAHRVIVRPEARIGGLTTEDIIDDILKTVPVDVH